jgi:DNA repair exonuclease SbcCD ATPase subunit
MREAKWYFIMLAIGNLLGAGLTLLFVYRPASATIAELRQESERLSGLHRAELDDYSELLKTTRSRVAELTDTLGAAEDANRAALDRAIRAEKQAQDIQKLIGQIQDSGERSSELNHSIRGETEDALGELRSLRGFLAENYTGGGEEGPSTED